jgi:hypothetical protein
MLHVSGQHSVFSRLDTFRYSDAVGSRTLSVPMAVPGGVDGESCQTACYNAGYHLAGTEYSVEVCVHLVSPLNSC